MAAAIYSTWLSNQSGEGGISPVHIEAVLVDFIVRISAQSFFWHAEFGVPVVQFKKRQRQSEFWFTIRIRFVESHRVDGLPASPIQSDRMK
jgi:hypothetical protein